MEIESFYCLITGELMEDPVVDREGNSYERTAIERWINEHGTSPITRSPLTLADLAPNRALKSAITDQVAAGIVLPPSSPFPRPIPHLPTVTEPVVDFHMYSSTDDQGTMVGFSVVAEEKDRIPSEVVVVIDVSGSMDDGVSNSEGVSSLSILDIVKHAVRTIIEILTPQDTLSLITFSDNSKVVFPLSYMTSQGKANALSILSNLQTEGSTNLWDGLRCGLEVLRQGSEVNHVRNSAVFLLTDGVPNVEPPRGHIPTLNKYRDSIGGSFPGVINTFGFGYSLDSKLLSDIAQIGGGMYSFIPDGGFVGTAFINAMANMLCSCLTNVSIDIECENSTQLLDDSTNEISATSSAGRRWTRKFLQCGQSMDYSMRINLPADLSGDMVTAILTYNYCGQSLEESPRKVVLSIPRGSLLVSSNSVEDISMWTDANISLACYKSFWRQKAVELVASLRDILNSDFHTQAAIANRKLSEFIASFQNWIEIQANTLALESMNDLLKDFTGQVSEACSRSDWFNKWGKHYLLSLGRSHELQQANNFKDPGIQHYGGSLFQKFRDQGDDIFVKIPPPEPSRPARSYVFFHGGPGGGAGAAQAGAPISMSSFHSRTGVCFHEDSWVELWDGSQKAVKDLSRGDLLLTGQKIMGIIETKCDHGMCSMVELPCGLRLTPWHPIQWNGQWTFPCDIFETKIIPCSSIYSFLVSPPQGNDDSNSPFGTSLYVQGQECLALAHGIENDPVASHPFFGTLQVVKSLESLSGWTEYGKITLNCHPIVGSVIRSQETGLIIGLCQPELDHAISVCH